ncbi:MAG: FmdB family zinc ribbon protein [Leptospirales bacterium]
MPIYEYQCDKCTKVYEKIQKFSDPIMEVCEVCGGPVVKLMGKPALQFKGTGFYITDYVRKGNNGEPSGDKKDSTKTEASESSAAASPAPSTSTGTSPQTSSSGSSGSGSSSQGSSGSGTSGESKTSKTSKTA